LISICREQAIRRKVSFFPEELESLGIIDGEPFTGGAGIKPPARLQ
jgi:hypothetical protein